MSETYGGTFAEHTPDNLIAGTCPRLAPYTVELKTQGVHKRGTVLSVESDGKYEVLGSGTGVASCIVCRDTAADDSIAAVYRAGNFNINALICAEGHTITETDKNELRKAGIILSYMQ